MGDWINNNDDISVQSQHFDEIFYIATYSLVEKHCKLMNFSVRPSQNLCPNCVRILEGMWPACFLLIQIKSGSTINEAKYKRLILIWTFCFGSFHNRLQYSFFHLDASRVFWYGWGFHYFDDWWIGSVERFVCRLIVMHAWRESAQHLLMLHSRPTGYDPGKTTLATL